MAPRHTASKWQQMEPYIRQAYITEKRTLDETIGIMSNEHGFVATARMYKQRLKHWRMQNKSVKRPEWLAMDAIYNNRMQQFGKETVFIVNKHGRIHKKVKRDIDKHYKRDNKVQIHWEEALRQAEGPGVIISYHTPRASPITSPELAARPMPQIPVLAANFDITEEQQRGYIAQTAHEAGREPSSSPESSPSLGPPGSPSSMASDESQEDSGQDTGSNASPAASMEDLLSGFRGLALKLNRPGQCHISAEEELRCNRLLSGLPDSPGPEEAYPHFTRRGTSWALDLENLDGSLIVASEWAAQIFMACYWESHKKSERVQPCRHSAMSSFRYMLKNPNDSVHTGLSWLVCVVTSHGQMRLLQDFLQDCCQTIDDVMGSNQTFSPLYHYTLAVVASDQVGIAKYGDELHLCHSTIKAVWGPETPNYLISSYYLAWHALYRGDHQWALATLLECLPLAERLMGRNHLVTINSLAMLHRAYLAHDNIYDAIARMVDAIDRCILAVGRQSPFRLELMYDLGMLYRRLGDLQRAEFMLKEVLEGQERVMGLDTRRTWTTIRDLKGILEEQGRVAEARMFYEEMNARYEWAWRERERARLAGGVEGR